MVVRERMTSPVVSIPPSMPVPEAMEMMRRQKIRRLPVVKDGELVGIVSDQDLIHASASPATTLSVWELNYVLSRITVEQVMTREVLTVNEDTPIQDAARLMAERKIGGLPVIRDRECVGIITETDLFRAFVEMLETGRMEITPRPAA